MNNKKNGYDDRSHLTERTKPFDGCILDEIISVFNNQIILCGSLCDYAHINYDAEVNDFDFMTNSSIFLKSFKIERFPDIIESQDFILNKKTKEDESFDCDISYIGTYKKIYSVDFFVYDQILKKSLSKINSIYINISSNIFYENSKYRKYSILSISSRKKRIEELLELVVERKNNESSYPEWREEWRKKKLRQILQKLPIYNFKSITINTEIDDKSS